MGEITPVNGLDHELQGLTCIPLRIHCAATPDTDKELSELDRMAIDTFVDELADITVSIIRRDTRHAEDIEWMRAAGYIRVSDISQVEGHSLDAQERAFYGHCKDQGWTPVRLYREEGRSAHVDSIDGRPVFCQMLEDVAKGELDVIVVHTLDRWSRNQKVMLEALDILSKSGIGLISITEKIEYSTPHGRFTTQTLGSVAELYSGLLSVHTKKGIDERALKGLRLGSIPFGYERCWESEGGERRLRCKPEHSGGIHVDLEEGPAVREMFKRYASGMVTLAVLAGELDDHGFRTRNTKKLPDGNGGFAAGPRLFTSASIRHILHNAIYCGKVRHKKELFPGVHEALISEEVYETVQDNMRRNSGRSQTLQQRPEREYLLKGLIQCAHCRMPMWAQTFVNGRPYYREQKGSRGAGYCVGKSGSMLCDVPDKQIGKIVSAIILPDAWVDRVLAQVHLADDVKRMEKERSKVKQRLMRLAETYVDGLATPEDYKRQKNLLEEKLRSLVVPDADAALEAGQLLEELPKLWKMADMSERRRILMTMLSEVYVDTVEEKRIVAIRPKPAFRALLEIATTREGSGVVLVSEHHDQSGQPDEIPSTLTPDGQGFDGNLCLWWRRGRVRLYREHGNSVLVAA